MGEEWVEKWRMEEGKEEGEEGRTSDIKKGRGREGRKGKYWGGNRRT